MSKFLDKEAVDALSCNNEDLSSASESVLENDSDGGDLSSDSENESVSVCSKKARKRRLSYSDSEDTSDHEKSRKKKSGRSTHVISRQRNSGAPENAREVLKEVRKSNKLLKTLVKRVGNTEKRLKVVEGTIHKNCTSCSSGVDSSTPTRSNRTKQDVPPVVRVSLQHDIQQLKASKVLISAHMRKNHI